MIKNFQESDFIDAFQDLPIYIGNDQSGEMLFKKDYSNGLSLIAYLDIYGEKLNSQFLIRDKTLRHSHLVLKALKSNQM